MSDYEYNFNVFMLRRSAIGIRYYKSAYGFDEWYRRMRLMSHAYLSGS